jgi:polyisoprenoid-binding protein YceI
MKVPQLILAAAAAVAVATTGHSSPVWTTRFVVAPAGNEVRYRVREQLAGFDLPNDAVGRSARVSGAIAFDADGRLLPAESRFVVDASAFVSDRDRRDRHVTERLLQASQFPEIVFAPTELRGIALPLTGAGPKTFELVGDLTVRRATHPTVWRVTARPTGAGVTGTASTRFVFEDFAMAKPRVRSVLSVADTIALEYDFNFVREAQ